MNDTRRFATVRSLASQEPRRMSLLEVVNLTLLLSFLRNTFTGDSR